MITLNGKYNTAKIFTDVIESSAEGQIQKLLDMKFISDSKIRIMPDVHAGAGCTIGTTMTITDKVIPNLVGVDIGCGMLTVKLKDKRIDLPKLDSFIHNNIPAGMYIRQNPHKYLDKTRIDELYCQKHVDMNRGMLSLGTLGGGNHFIEIDKDDDGNLYLIIHTGSCHIGLQTAKYYQDAAFKAMDSQDEIPYELAYCERELLTKYLHDMEIMQDFADWNRHAIADTIIKGCKLKVDSQFTTIHNYIDLKHMILRKGAVSAQLDETLLIPINMRDGALICRGLGNPDWNYSAPHGSGRVMSRSEVKNNVTLNAYKATMKGIFSTTINSGTLDEYPMAYKGIDEIVSNITPTAEIITRIKPIYNFKSDK